jgi:hypothetical protein
MLGISCFGVDFVCVSTRVSFSGALRCKDLPETVLEDIMNIAETKSVQLRRLRLQWCWLSAFSSEVLVRYARTLRSLQTLNLNGNSFYEVRTHCYCGGISIILLLSPRHCVMESPWPSRCVGKVLLLLSPRPRSFLLSPPSLCPSLCSSQRDCSLSPICERCVFPTAALLPRLFLPACGLVRSLRVWSCIPVKI